MRWQSILLDVFALFGYNPWRTVAWMTFFVMMFAGLWFWAAHDCARSDCMDESVFVRTDLGRFSPDQARLDVTYPEFNSLAFSFDLFIPVISFGHQDHWRPNTRYKPFASFKLTDPRSWLKSAMTGAPTQKETFTMRLTWGGVLYVFYVLEMIIGIILTSLAVTGFTGLLRRDD